MPFIQQWDSYNKLKDIRRECALLKNFASRLLRTYNFTFWYFRDSILSAVPAHTRYKQLRILFGYCFSGQPSLIILNLSQFWQRKQRRILKRCGRSGNIIQWQTLAQHMSKVLHLMSNIKQSKKENIAKHKQKWKWGWRLRETESETQTNRDRTETNGVKIRMLGSSSCWWCSWHSMFAYLSVTKGRDI